MALSDHTVDHNSVDICRVGVQNGGPQRERGRIKEAFGRDKSDIGPLARGQSADSVGHSYRICAITGGPGQDVAHAEVDSGRAGPCGMHGQHHYRGIAASVEPIASGTGSRARQCWSCRRSGSV